ncbi:85/88 kDa calcium-independent phospholipase A2-like [Liolophura sinensis]|uniref:85/88 kDa calcium-independent phospholipase A2-like n=1 Tax=Liolophura sinensis TaxID=3198878 RepID=UPI0031594CA3
MSSFFKVVGGLINAAGANINPYKVQVCEPEKQKKEKVVERNDAMTLYKQTGCFEAVLYHSAAHPGNSFSLFRLTNEGEASSTFKKLASILVPLYKSTLKVYQEQMLQLICDTVRQNPTWTVAHVAAHVGLVDALKHKPISRCLNTATTDTALTPLMVAITAGHQACVEEMLKQGAKLDMVKADGDTAYHKAVIYCPDAIELMAKADHNGVINWLNASGQSALHLACSESKPDSTDKLLSNGADVNATGCDTKPIHMAFKVGDIESARKILTHHPDQINSRDSKYNGTPVHWAKSKEAVELCVEKGCDLNAVSEAGDSPLNIMLERGRLDCVTGLLCHGTCVNAAGKGGNTPLHLAVKKDNIDLIKSLIVFGANVDAKNDNNQTARHLVATSKLKNRDVMLYIFHRSGAERCGKKTKGCLNGCVSEGSFNGKPDESMEELLSQERMAVDDVLDDALSRGVDSVPETDNAVNPQRVLCLDGGGIRGIVLIQMLIAIEKAAAVPIKECFDWIGGTSTGGILAIGIAIGKPLQQILGMYFGLRDKVFVGTRPYPSKPLEDLLKKELSETLVMSDIKYPKILVTGALADRFPPELHYFRNYVPPIVYRPTSEGPLQSVHPPPSEQLVWQAARCSGAAPTYFRASGPFLDGGLVSNNPTLDVMTEIHEYNIGLKTQGRHEEITPLGVIVSLGTGRIPTVPVRTIDIFKPGGLFDAWKSAQGMSALINILQEQATVTEGRPNDRARAWCSMINVPFFRFSPQLSEDVPLDAHDDKTILNMMWETQCYIATKKHKFSELGTLLRGNNPHDKS